MKKNVFYNHSHLGNTKQLLCVTSYEEIKQLVNKTDE